MEYSVVQIFYLCRRLKRTESQKQIEDLHPIGHRSLFQCRMNNDNQTEFEQDVEQEQ